MNAGPLHTPGQQEGALAAQREGEWAKLLQPSRTK